MTVALIVLGLGAYAAFLLWRVRSERGWVGFPQPSTPFQLAMLRFRWGIAHMEHLIGTALLPAFRRANDAMLAWREAWLRPDQEVK